MTVITHARRKSNLAKMIDSAGGVSVGVALAAARANIEKKRAEAMEIVEAQVTALEAVPVPATPGEAPSRLEQAYHTATGVIDAAGPFELRDICQAAAGLCDLIDAAPAGGKFDWRIVTVHAQSLRLLLTLPPEAIEARVRVLDSLRQVVNRKTAQTG
ncbi:hypothetical protein GCM10007859_06210 [Brevundimonas denitrificans]|uniref:Chemotaxis protein CheE n=1 Tax=Brevundimonas denitrificans TaxID=1443434 RepID=A0ABQ6BG22_9CAUL|nr:chemotaxis protein CheE [Brevundimonas denitrificans]GLS00614.1 hypothetical protein GCM10007859_06210 [Brevundimonas denitrificans]